MIRLSICIPIYNCAEFIGQALDSILSQTKEGVEVIVYDGGSTDGTAVLMDGYVKNWANLHYHQGSERGGIDADIVKCVGFAKGEFCWLFSGDDVMRSGAIKKALEWINQGCDIYICKHTICSKDMVVSHEHPVLQPDQIFIANLANSTERLEWFQRAVTTEAFFSFISGLIVRKAKWDSGELPENFNKSYWGMAARFFGLLTTELTVCYVAEVWLDQRGDNDSFADQGVVNRFRLGIQGYHRLADSFFGHESIEAFHIRRVIRREFTLLMLLNTKIKCVRYPMRESRQMLDELIRMIYCDKSLTLNIKRYIYFVAPYWFLVAARFVYQPIARMRRMLKNV